MSMDELFVFAWKPLEMSMDEFSFRGNPLKCLWMSLVLVEITQKGLWMSLVFVEFTQKCLWMTLVFVETLRNVYG